MKYISEENNQSASVADPVPPKPVVTHLPVPVPLKAIYITGWVAGTPHLRDPLIKLIEDTELNAVVIDIKDYTGKLSYEPVDEELKAYGSYERRISDMRGLIQTLHEKNIYVIGRISSFQDAFMVKKRPDLAVKRASDGGIWQDRKGISWIDASAKPMWEYLALIGWDAYENQGFDELNFDYIRFPSDGNMKDIAYPFSQNVSKSKALEGFYAFLHKEFKGREATTTPAVGNQLGNVAQAAELISKPIKEGPIISADLFGMVTSNKDDLGIGQVLESALPYFDYIAPMVYPSHYPKSFLGYNNPAEHPYEVIKYAMDKAVERTKIASTSPEKLRPWLQDFNLGATYTPAMVRAQIQATYDSGLDSWLLWSASNKYTAGALKKD